jgi:hypothetical protein
MKTFKNIFAGKEKFKELGILTKVTGFLVPFTLFMAMTFQSLWKKLFQTGGRLVGQAIFAVGDLLGPLAGSVADIGAIKTAGEFATGYAKRAELSGNLMQKAAAETFASARSQIAKGDIVAATAETRQALMDKGSEWSVRVGKFLTYVVLPVICLVVVLFLFSELVDAIQIRKLHKQEEAKMQQHSISDIL